MVVFEIFPAVLTISLFCVIIFHSKGGFVFVFGYIQKTEKDFSILNYPLGVPIPEEEISINSQGIQACYPCRERDDEAVHLFYNLFTLRYEKSILTFGEAVRSVCFDAFLRGYTGDVRPDSVPSFLNDYRYFPNNRDGMRVFEEILRLMLPGQEGPVNAEWGGSMRAVLEYLEQEAWRFGNEILDAVR